MTDIQQTPSTPETSAAGAAAPLTAVQAGVAQFGEVRDIPLNRLKASPSNVRRVGHSPEVIASRAATIGVKGVLQPLVVEPEVKAGKETGYYLVTAGEGRRQALRLLAKRKALSKAVPVRCVVDTTNDPAEVSLDENISQEPMHPADQFEAFNDLAQRKGYGAEEIAARFGVKPDTVRRRLRLGAAAPELLDQYREGALTLEQLMAFSVNPDTERQLQVYAQLPFGSRHPDAIRRAMMDTKVSTNNRRVKFLGLDAYVEAGGVVLRDLFTEELGGWIEDVVLLDRLVGEKLDAIAQDVRDREGWKWASAHLETPQGHGCSRIWEHVLPRTAEQVEAINALEAEDAALTEQWADVDPPPPEVAARFEAIEVERQDLGGDYGHTSEEKARGGVMVVLMPYGEARIERGFVRPEDELAPEPDEEQDDDGVDDRSPDGGRLGEGGAQALSGEGDDDAGQAESDEADEPLGDAAAPLPDRVVAELTAHRTAALRDALAQDPDLAQIALAHALVSRVFGMGGVASCLDIRWGSRDLTAFGEGIAESPAGLAVAERHQLWTRQMPSRIEDYWTFVVGLDGDSRASLLAHCVSLTLDGLRTWERRPATVLAHAETLATALDLDMRAYWAPTGVRYLDRVTKAQIVAAVTDGVSAEAAARITGLKKPQMVEVAEPLLVEAGWLPVLLRTAKTDPAQPDDPEPAAGHGEVPNADQGQSLEAIRTDHALAASGAEPAAEPLGGGEEAEPPLLAVEDIAVDPQLSAEEAVEVEALLDEAA